VKTANATEMMRQEIARINLKRKKVTSDAVSKTYLCYVWGVGKNYPKTMVSKQKKNISAFENPPPAKHVVDCYVTAEQCHSAKALFVNDYIGKKEAYNTDFRNDERKRYRTLANIAWERQRPLSKGSWESMSRAKLAAQPKIKDLIIDTLRNNYSVSFEKL